MKLTDWEKQEFIDVVDTFKDLKPSLKKKSTNKKANGVHKYLKQYLKMYNWKDREKVIKDYTDLIRLAYIKSILSMKERFDIIQADFDSFVKYLKHEFKEKTN